MKRFLIFLIVAIVAVNIYHKLPGSSAQTITPEQQTQLRTDQENIDRVKQLEKLQSPQYVLGEIHKVGKLTTLQSSYKYSSNIKNEALFGHLTLREITLDFTYNFAIGMDLQYIKIRSISNKTITIQIPKAYLQLMYIELDSSSKIIDGKNMIFVSQFKPSDVQTLINQSQQNCANEIGSNSKLFEQALANLESNLKDLILKLGYENVQFEVI